MKALLRHLVNLLLWLLPPSRLFPLRRQALRLAGVNVAHGACVCGRGWIYGRGVLEIGLNSWLSPGVIVTTHPDAPVRIGANCDVGHGAEFITGSHLIGGPGRRAGQGTALPITVGDGSWIGTGARILGGVSIGRGCIVAAGAVLTRSVPDNTLVAGVPAVSKRSLPEA